MNAHLDDLVEKLSQLSVLDMAKLKKALEEKWGVKAAVAAAAVLPQLLPPLPLQLLNQLNLK